MPIAAVFGHRGITHSLLAVVGLALALRYGLAQWQLVGTGWALVAVGVAAGYLSHIAGDFVTRGGVPLLWPVKRRFIPADVFDGWRLRALAGLCPGAGRRVGLAEHFARGTGLRPETHADRAAQLGHLRRARHRRRVTLAWRQRARHQRKRKARAAHLARARGRAAACQRVPSASLNRA